MSVIIFWAWPRKNYRLKESCSFDSCLLETEFCYSDNFMDGKLIVYWVLWSWRCVASPLMGLWNSPRGDSLSHLKFVLNCHTGFSRPLCSINKRYLEQENENSETSKFISICHRTESCLCVINYMSFCFSVSFTLDYDMCHVSWKLL